MYHSVPKARPNMSSGIVRKKSVSEIWLRWACIDARLRPGKSADVDAVGDDLGRLAEVRLGLEVGELDALGQRVRASPRRPRSARSG